MKKEFIDCHCHIFNISDIPLYEVIEDKVKMSTMVDFIKLLGAGAISKNVIKKNEDFIRFFERDLVDSILKFQNHLQEVENIDLSKTLITPLTMDFDKIKNIEKPEGDISILEYQLKRLIDAIEKVEKMGKLKIKICPFIGFDLRKLDDENGLEYIKNLWEKYSDKKNKNAPIDKLISGKVLGIKIYPPIGFSPYPSNKLYRKKYLEFYKWCCKEDIPLTVHCQEGSFNTDKNISITQVTHPDNWLKLFEENPEISKLRINFAHFGGEKELDDTLDKIRIWNNGINENTWTYGIIKLLQKYENTYSDISAYDYNEENSKNLTELFEKSLSKDFEEGAYKLENKILWGSDVPMIISLECYNKKYSNYYGCLKKVISNCNILDSNNQNKLLENISVLNSKKFLNLK